MSVIGVGKPLNPTDIPARSGYHMLDIKNLDITYGLGKNEVRALESVTLHISKGEYLAVLGSNGSGKSTLIKVVCGMVPFGIGEVKLSGRDISPGRFGEDLFGKVAVVFQ
jgi:ABC-type dipeptide/oligopeptide/nickel transport system ATPase subunit